MSTNGANARPCEEIPTGAELLLQTAQSVPLAVEVMAATTKQGKLKYRVHSTVGRNLEIQNLHAVQPFSGDSSFVSFKTYSSTPNDDIWYTMRISDKQIFEIGPEVSSGHRTPNLVWHKDGAHLFILKDNKLQKLTATGQLVAEVALPTTQVHYSVGTITFPMGLQYRLEVGSGTANPAIVVSYAPESSNGLLKFDPDFDINGPGTAFGTLHWFKEPLDVGVANGSAIAGDHVSNIVHDGEDIWGKTDTSINEQYWFPIEMNDAVETEAMEFPAQTVDSNLSLSHQVPKKLADGTIFEIGGARGAQELEAYLWAGDPQPNRANRVTLWTADDKRVADQFSGPPTEAQIGWPRS